MFYSNNQNLSRSQNLKKILCLIIAVLTISMQTLPAFAEDDTFYDFSDEAQEEFTRQEMATKEQLQKNAAKEIKSGPKLEKTKRKDMVKPQPYEPQEIYQPEERAMTGTVIVVPQGQEFEAQLQSSINSESLTENDTIAAVLNKDWIYNGRIIAPEGSVVYGRATDIKKAGYAYANGKLAMTFDEVMTPAGDRIRLTATKVYIDVKGNRALKTAGNVAVGALIGLAIGALTTATSGNVVGGLAVGAAVGAAGGMMKAVATKGESAEVPAGRIVIVRLIEPVEVVPYE